MKAITLSDTPKPVLLDWKRRGSYTRGEKPIRFFSPELAGLLVKLESGPMAGDDPVDAESEESNPVGGITPKPFNAD